MSVKELEVADELFAVEKYREAYELLDELSEKDTAEVQWRLAWAVYVFSLQTSNSDEKEKYVRQAFDYCERALQLDATCFGANKWFGAILSEKSALDGTIERIKQLGNVKKHFTIAKDTNDADQLLWHMLGVFNFKLSELNWVSWQVIKSVAENPPTTSFEEALECFEKAEALAPGFYGQNQLYLGKTYLALRQKDKARDWLLKAAAVKVCRDDDRECREEAAKVLKKM